MAIFNHFICKKSILWGLLTQKLYLIIYKFIINNANIFLGQILTIFNKNGNIIAHNRQLLNNF